jgi:hypothetical protein
VKPPLRTSRVGVLTGAPALFFGPTLRSERDDGIRGITKARSAGRRGYPRVHAGTSAVDYGGNGLAPLESPRQGKTQGRM